MQSFEIPMKFFLLNYGTQVVKSKVEQVEKKENNPATVVKLKVTNLESKFESKVTMNLYHSSQGFHLQGGRRQGKNTSCSLAATVFQGNT